MVTLARDNKGSTGVHTAEPSSSGDCFMWSVFLFEDTTFFQPDLIIEYDEDSDNPKNFVKLSLKACVIFLVKEVPPSREITKGIPQVGNTFTNRFFATVRALAWRHGKLQPTQKTHTQ